MLNAKDMTEYEQLARELFNFGNIKQFKMFVAMQSNKRTFLEWKVHDCLHLIIGHWD